ncbi:MAG: VanZ family protein [Pirellulaceae bacterium]
MSGAMHADVGTTDWMKSARAIPQTSEIPQTLGLGLLQRISLMARLATVILAMYWFVIFLGTHLPSDSLPKLGWSDKVYHGMAFAGLAFLLAWSLPKRHSNGWRHAIVVACIACVYASFDEFTQRFIPGRTSDIMDVAADVFGILGGLLAYTLLRNCLMRIAWGRHIIARLAKPRLFAPRRLSDEV